VRSFGCPLSYHPGEDIAGPLGSPVHAVSNGTVIFFSEYQNEFSSYLVVLEHTAPPGIQFKLPGGRAAEKVWSACYHLSGIDPKNVGLNRIVKRGARIGFMGDFPHGSGKAIHLHFEIRKVNLWNGSAYISAGKKEVSICNKPQEWITEHFVCPSDFIRLNRSR
jgi:murein DD-endopeptidase MepM/ murein hydrolase activator NlpD